VTASCGDDGGAERESAGATTTTTLAAPPSSEATTAPTEASTTTAAPARRGPAATTAATSTTAAPAGTPSAAQFTAPGTYRYAATGQFTSTLGGPQPRNGETTLTVDPPSGTDQRSVRLGLGRTTEQVLRVDGAGAHLVSMRITDQGVVKEVRPSPPVLALPADAAVGRTWAWRATTTDGATTVDATMRALRQENVTVGGVAVPALVVEAVLTLTGDLVSTSKQTLWVSDRHRLIVRQDDATEGRLGIVAFSSTSSETLVTLAPR
jgi:hypothetical protein